MSLFLIQHENDASAFAADVVMSYQLTDQLNLSATLEKIKYNDNFKQSFGVVPVEQRLTLSFDLDINGWDIFLTTTWVGSRNLAEYGSPARPSFDIAGTELKTQKANSYWTMDFRIAKWLNDNLQLYTGASNLFDYTHVGDMEGPLFFAGGKYDVAHIYGPFRGREACAGLKYSF